MSYAENTSVPVERSRAEIESLVRKHGASQFGSGWDGTMAGVTFVMRNRRVKFTIEIPDEAAAKVALRKNQRYRWSQPSGVIAAWQEQEERRRWRCLVLSVKAKLETVANGVGTFEQEFLAHIVTDNGQTVFERMTTDTQMTARMLPAVGDSP
jgi:hypothetical protein